MLRQLKCSVFYFIQGTLASYRTFEEPYLSIRFNRTLSDFAESQALFSTAWGLKPFQGYITDNFNLCGLGHRRPYAFLGPLIGGASFVLLPYIKPVGSVWSAYLFVIFARSFGIAQMDAAVDGLLVDADVGDRGSMFQGLMMASRVIGELFSTSVGATIAGASVNPDLWFFMAAFTFIAVPFAFMIKEEKKRSEEFDWRALKALLLPPVILLNVWNVLAQIGNRVTGLPLTRWARTEFGLGPDEVGYMTSVSLVFQVLGCAFQGYFMDRWNRRWLLYFESSLFVLSNVINLGVRDKLGAWAFWIFSGLADGMHGAWACVYRAASRGGHEGPAVPRLRLHIRPQRPSPFSLCA